MSARGLIDVVHWLESVFDGLGLKRSYGGAIAYNFYGPPRLTQDIDVLVLVPDTRIPGLLDALRASGCLHGDRDPRPIDVRAVLADLRGAGRVAVFLCHGIRVEVFVPWHPFHHRVLDRSPERDLEDRKIRIHAPEDLIVFKKIFDRPKDLADIRAILATQAGRLDTGRILSDAEAFLEPESLNELKALLAAPTTAG